MEKTSTTVNETRVGSTRRDDNWGVILVALILAVLLILGIIFALSGQNAANNAANNGANTPTTTNNNDGAAGTNETGTPDADTNDTPDQMPTSFNVDVDL